ncbi:MAG TPA: type 4a pilus biogenesis protein PilO [Candidatus Saccharimonadia bacterium]|nr:type 4a pilus biogenesis protein PilO [Candidatus Saccharimonadia bacterium]
MNTPVSNAPQSMAMFRDASVRELQQFYQKPIAKVSAELIITIVTVIFLALFAIRPTLDTMSALLKDIDDKTKVDQDLTKKAATLSTLNTQIVPLNNEIMLLNTVIPSSPDIDGLLRRIERVASGRPVQLISVQSTTLPKDSDSNLKGTPALSPLTISVGVKGTYTDIVDYLRALLSMDRELTVLSMTIATTKEATTAAPTSSGTTKSTSAATSPNLSMNIIFQAHYFGVPVEESATP